MFLKYIWLTEYQFFLTDETNPIPKKKNKKKKKKKNKKRKNKGNSQADEPSEKRVCPGEGK